MLSRRALTFLSLCLVTILILVLTSARSRYEWSLDSARYNHLLPGSLSGGHTINAGTGNKNDVHVPQVTGDPACHHFPDTRNILLVMKTGASESFQRVPTQLMTVLRCLPDFLIFSDMNQTIAGHQIHDSLDTVLDDLRRENEDFDLYRRQQACLVDQAACNKHVQAGIAEEGWNLDKYKNVHMAEKTYNLRPGYDWYLFVDADTYVLWPNLVQWLRRLDPARKLYLGSVSMLDDYGFGHGGSGYVVSQAALKEMVAPHPGIGNRFDKEASQSCCGDYIFARALENTTQTRVTQSLPSNELQWPTINGEKPFTLPFQAKHWCQPIVTMHHMNSEEISSFWEYEWQRFANPALSPSSPDHPPPPLRIRDIFHDFVKPRLTAIRRDWDNLSDDRFYLDQAAPPGAPGHGRAFEDWEVDRAKKKHLSPREKVAHASWQKCRDACDEEPKCFQYRWQNGLCGLSWSFKLGAPAAKGEEEAAAFTSGWNMRRIKRFLEEMDGCDEVSWPKVDD
ncbi:glycosyltransferase family 31 protein [Sodiomyces alcalophilus JCM 7366]|uniref:glycosyltransferase family 31 protein n=1 Tax=Sodiomyces alcalophilus JCM 7366 TaxID=591952 RepID=UPI0039B682E7